jgi:hypothetical protein
MDTPIYSDIVKKLGTLKNELLIFVIIGCIIINAAAVPLSYSDKELKYIGGIIMHLLSIFIFVGFGIFYCFAFWKLPGSDQESDFQKSAEKFLTDHKRKKEEIISIATG